MEDYLPCAGGQFQREGMTLSIDDNFSNVCQSILGREYMMDVSVLFTLAIQNFVIEIWGMVLNLSLLLHMVLNHGKH